MFSSRAEILPWLSRQQRTVPLVIAVRSALRIFPTLSYALRDVSAANSAKIRKNLILPAFQASAVSWVVARYPHNASDLKELATKAADSAFLARNIARDDYSDEVIEAVATAARAAASSDYLDLSLGTIEAALTAAAPARASEANDAAAAMLAAVIDDANAIDRAVAPEDVAGLPLWSAPFPDWARDRWGRLRNSLRQTEDNWSVWIDWYGARLNGELSVESVELRRVKTPIQIDLFDSKESVDLIRDASARASIERPKAAIHSGAKSANSPSLDERKSVPRYDEIY